MKKVEPIVWKETAFVSIVVLLLSAIMNGVFLLLSAWNFTVLLGTFLGAFAACANFFLMAFSLQKSLEKSPEDAKKFMKLSHAARLFGMFLVALAGYLAPCFHVVAVVVPFLFPRVAVMVRALFPAE